jgi:1-acyl-sn-glycerol-3-phosphate acyltransferase
MKDFDFENKQWSQLPPHIQHLPIFTRHFDLFSYLVKFFWSFILKHLFFKFYIRLKIRGSFHEIYKKHPRLLIISNHTSHLDAISIAAGIPLSYWGDLYIAAAKDYFFSNPLFTFFSQHCLGAIPIDRRGKKGEAIKLITTLLSQLDRMWLIMFPEGTRSQDGRIQTFKKGVSVFSEKTQTPILFLYIKGGAKLWPKGQFFASPGSLEIYLGPVHKAAPVDILYEDFQAWVQTLPE